MTTKKIDIYLRPFRTRTWVYECSTVRSGTLKQARARFCALHGLHPSQVKVCFADK
jgi:hypothetical protein